MSHSCIIFFCFVSQFMILVFDKSWMDYDDDKPCRVCVCVCVCVCVFYKQDIYIYTCFCQFGGMCHEDKYVCVCVCVCSRVKGSCRWWWWWWWWLSGWLWVNVSVFFFFLLVQKHNLNCVCVIIQSFSGFLFFPMIIWLFSMCVCMRYFLVIPGHYYFFFQCCNRAFFFFHHQWWWWWWWYIIFHVCLWAPSIQLLVNEWINGHWNGFKKIFRFKLSYITFIYSWKWLYIDFKTCTRVAEQKEIRILEF